MFFSFDLAMLYAYSALHIYWLLQLSSAHHLLLLCQATLLCFIARIALPWCQPPSHVCKTYSLRNHTVHLQKHISSVKIQFSLRSYSIRHQKQRLNSPSASPHFFTPKTPSNSKSLLAASPKVSSGLLGTNPNFSFHSPTSSILSTFSTSLPSLGNLPFNCGMPFKTSTASWELYLLPPMRNRLLATVGVVSAEMWAVARSRTSICFRQLTIPTSRLHPSQFRI